MIDRIQIYKNVYQRLCYAKTQIYEKDGIITDKH